MGGFNFIFCVAENFIKTVGFDFIVSNANDFIKNSESSTLSTKNIKTSFLYPTAKAVNLIRDLPFLFTVYHLICLRLFSDNRYRGAIKRIICKRQVRLISLFERNEIYMNRLIIKVGSVTFALKARDILSARNIRSFVRKTPNPSKGEGCGYSLVVPNATESVIGVLRLSGIEILETQWEK